jgi:hypothetical protein
MKTTAIDTATVSRSCSRPFETKFGTRIAAEFTLSNGSQTKIFTDPNDTDFQQLQRGDTVELIQSGRGWTFARLLAPSAADFDPSPAPGTSRPSAPASPTVGQIQDYVSKQLRLYALCFEQVSACSSFSGLQADDKRSIATTLYLSASRKFF